VDKRDLDILRILEENSRATIAEIAKKLGISESNVRKRLRRMEENGVIRKYTVIEDPAKLGYSVIAILGFDTTPEKNIDVAKKLSEFDEVKRVLICSGSHTLVAEVWARSGEELSKLICQKYGKIDGITKVYTSIVLERIK